MKRDRTVMLRFSAQEHAQLLAAKPEDEELAAFARRLLMSSLSNGEIARFRQISAFIVAALSDSIEFEEALTLYDQHVTSTPEAPNDGNRNEVVG